MNLTSLSSDWAQRNTLSSQTSDPQRNQSGRQAQATDQLLNRLAEKIPGMSAGGLRELEADAFTPEKVAERIGGFVAQGLENARRDGKSAEDLQKMYDAAMSGIQKGFEEASDILSNLNLLTDDIATTIDQTRDLTFDKLAALDPSQASLPVSGTQTSILAAERYDKAETFSLQVKTQDGDDVTITFSRADHAESSLGAYSDASGSAISYSMDRSSVSDYQFSVEGNLDNDEIDALQNLIKDVNSIADDFFDGDIQEAFDKASEFRMDKTELASMNLTLTRSESYSSVAAYEKVGQLGDGSEGADKNAGRKLGHMLQELKDSMANPGLGFLQSRGDFSQDLLGGLLSQDSRFKGADDDKQALFESNIESMRSIIDSLAPDVEDDD